MSRLPTGSRGRAVAVLLLLAAVLFVWFGAIAPLRNFYVARAESLTRQRMLARRMESLAAAVPALERLAQTQAGQAVPIPALEGATDGVAAANLQEKLNEFAIAAGLHIASAETLPAETAGAWRAIGVRVTVSGPWPELTRLLLAITQSDTPMVADDLQLRGPPTYTSLNTPEHNWPVDATFTVTAWRETGT